MTTKDVGDRVNVRYLAYLAGVETTATMALVVTDPTGATSSPSITFTAPNQYDASFQLTSADVWYWTWTASGTIEDTETGQVTAQVPGPAIYSSLSLLKQALGTLVTDTTRDDLLTLALAGASRSVEQYCDGRVFTLATAATARTFTLGARRVMCTAWGDRVNVDDIGALDDLLVEAGDGTSYTTIADAETHPDNALARGWAITAIVSPNSSLGGFRKLRVTARWGWPQVPTAVEQATLLQAARLYWRKDSPGGVAGGSEWGIVRVPNLDPDVKALLAPYTSGLLVA